MAIPNLEDYKNKVKKGLISIQKIDDENMAIGTKRFSAKDGVELANEVVGVTVTEVDEAIVEKQVELDELKAFKSDLVVSE